MKRPADACEIVRMLEELLSAALARTSPRDACRAAAVSPAFRAAANSDPVWSVWLPHDLPPLADGELTPAPLSKKELFLLLSDRPVLLSGRLMSMWLDRETGAKCYMLSARALAIVWGGTPQYWRWIPLNDSRFSEGAELLDVCWLEIHGNIHGNMLSHNSTYAAYMVFKMANVFYGLDSPFQDALVSVGDDKSTRKVCLQWYDDEDENRPVTMNVLFPQQRADGWLELEMGEFFIEGSDDGEVSISLMGMQGGHWKKGLIVQGIEIRFKKSG